MTKEMMSTKDYVGELVSMMKKTGYQNLRLHFRMRESDASVPIESLDLNVRPINALKRGGIFTLKDLVDKYNTSRDLSRIKNMGVKSVGEIIGALVYTHIDRNINEGRKPYEDIEFI